MAFLPAHGAKNSSKSPTNSIEPCLLYLRQRFRSFCQLWLLYQHSNLAQPSPPAYLSA